MARQERLKNKAKKKSKRSKHADSAVAVSRSEHGKQDRERVQLQKAERRRPAASSRILTRCWQLDAVTFLLIVLATVALYAGDLRAGFLGVDDPQYVVDNPWIRALNLENLRHILSSPYFANYSPLHLLSYMLDYALAGANAFGFHLSSNIWGGLVAGFVFLVALALTRRRDIALASAVLFVFYPVHVEAIAWIASRKDLVAAAFALPSLLAYLRYREGGTTAKRWYITSLVLFQCAVAVKMSVATFAAVFLAHDLFVEKRPLKRSLWDKAPFLLMAGLIALMVASAQPSHGHRPNTYVIAAAFAQSLWLLTGFGTYVIYRVPPNLSAGALLQIGGAAMLLAIFAAPLLLRRRWPMATVLAYWILFGLIPAQVLLFMHPVTDRYLFFPSVGAAILIAWGIITAGERLRRGGLIGARAVLAAITILWGVKTLAYVREWRDPRSVWYAATAKSSDPEAYYNLGSHYQDVAGRLGTKPRGAPLTEPDARRLASAVWAGDPRLPALFAEWAGGQHDGPLEKAFRAHLRTLAWDAFEQRVRTKGVTSMPNLYFRRGLILTDGNDLQGARKEFLAAAEEASHFPLAETRQEFLVRSHSALGIIAWNEHQYTEAMGWLTMAEEEQTRAGGNWERDLTANRKRLEGIIGAPQAR